MVSNTYTRTFTFDPADTCKERWDFTISDGPDGLVIEEVTITPSVGPNGQPVGCQGHPQTIGALLQGLPVDSIDITALSQAACSRNLACGQALARCLADLKT